MHAIVRWPAGLASSTGRRMTVAGVVGLAGIVATLLTLLLAASAGAYNSPYTRPARSRPTTPTAIR